MRLEIVCGKRHTGGQEAQEKMDDCVSEKIKQAVKLGESKEIVR